MILEHCDATGRCCQCVDGGPSDPASSVSNTSAAAGRQIAAVRNNLCGVGLAYNSKVAGLRILSGPVTDADEATALNYDYQNTSLYSCSWGPRDNGQSMEGPNYVIQKAVVEGINNGQGGNGLWLQIDRSFYFLCRTESGL